MEFLATSCAMHAYVLNLCAKSFVPCYVLFKENCAIISILVTFLLLFILLLIQLIFLLITMMTYFQSIF